MRLAISEHIGLWISEARAGLAADEGRAMRIMVALGALLVNCSIGLAYARHISVQGWQLWTWLISVIAAVGALLSGAGRPPLKAGNRWRWLGVILLAAFLTRLLWLDRIPGGLHVDEYGVADFSLRHVFAIPNETINPFRTSVASQPTLYNYLIRLSLAIVGPSISGLRIWSVLAGTAGVLATYALVATYQDRRTALIAAVLMTFYHYHIHWSRIGLNNIWDTLWVPLMLAAFSWGRQKDWSGGAVISGFAVGMSQYFYAGSRLGLLLLLFVVWRCWRRETDRKGLVGYTATMVLVAAIIAAPIMFMAIRDPAPFFERSRVVLGWKPEIMARVTGEPIDFWGYFGHQLGRSVGAYVAIPDVTGFYAPGVPLLIGLAAPLFVVGVLWATYKRRTLPVLWILLTVLFGGFLLSDPPGSSHYVISIPAVSWLVAVPISWLSDRSQRGKQFALALLSMVLVVDLFFYFLIYVPGKPYDLIHPFPPLP